MLADLRQLEAVAARAARIGRVTPPLIKALGTVRSLYDELMVRAARAPGAGLGPRLYTARRGPTSRLRKQRRPPVSPSRWCPGQRPVSR